MSTYKGFIIVSIAIIFGFVVGQGQIKSQQPQRIEITYPSQHYTNAWFRMQIDNLWDEIELRHGTTYKGHAERKDND